MLREKRVGCIMNVVCNICLRRVQTYTDIKFSSNNKKYSTTNTKMYSRADFRSWHKPKPQTWHLVTAVSSAEVDLKLQRARQSITVVHLCGLLCRSELQTELERAGCVRVSCLFVLPCSAVWWGVVRMGPSLQSDSDAEERRWWALWSQQTECGSWVPPHSAKAGRGPQLLSDHVESHQRTMLLHLIEHYNMADCLTSMELVACHNCSVQLSPKPQVHSYLTGKCYVNPGLFCWSECLLILFSRFPGENRERWSGSK